MFIEKLFILARPSSPINTQIEMDVTSRQNSLSFETPANYQSTNGIHIQNVSLKKRRDQINILKITEFTNNYNFIP